MNAFNMDLGDDLTTTGGGIAEDGATAALRAADKHPRNTPQRLIDEPNRMVRIFDHHTGMKDAMAFIMFLYKAHVDDIVYAPGALQDEHTERIRKQLLADPCGENGTPRTTYWFRRSGGPKSEAVRTKPGLRLQDLNQKVYVAFRANAYRLMAPEGAKRLKQSIDKIDSDNGLLHSAERLEHEDYVTFGHITEMMTLYTRRQGGAAPYARLLRRIREKDQPLSQFALQVDSLRGEIKMSDTPGYGQIDDEIFIYKLASFIANDEQRHLQTQGVFIWNTPWEELLKACSSVPLNTFSRKYKPSMNKVALGLVHTTRAALDAAKLAGSNQRSELNSYKREIAQLKQQLQQLKGQQKSPSRRTSKKQPSPLRRT